MEYEAVGLNHLALDRSQGRNLVKRQWNFGVHKRRHIAWLAEPLIDFQEGLYSTELVKPWNLRGVGGVADPRNSYRILAEKLI
jgi:hypothetical protein